MARYKVTFGGFVIEMESPEDVRDLMLAGNTVPTAPTRERRPYVRRKQLVSHGKVIGGAALNLLRTLQGSKAGMSSQVLGKKLKVRALGRAVHSLRVALKGSGISANDALQKTAANGTLLWFPGDKINEAIELLAKGISEAQEGAQA